MLFTVISFEQLQGKKKTQFLCSGTSENNHYMEIRYSRAKKLLEVNIAADFSDKWSQWQIQYELVLLDLAGNLLVSPQQQVFKIVSKYEAFSSPIPRICFLNQKINKCC